MPKRLSSSANKNSFNLQSLQNLNGMSGSQSVSESVSQSVSLSVSQSVSQLGCLGSLAAY